MEQVVAAACSHLVCGCHRNLLRSVAVAYAVAAKLLVVAALRYAASCVVVAANDPAMVKGVDRMGRLESGLVARQLLLIKS